jgi:hypothetical protein
MSKFCGECGESTTVHSPSAGEFLHEFIGHYVALEGKLWSTLKLLMFRPGQLTAEFLRGRRVRYVNPLRLYLTLSLVLFALIKIVGIELPQVNIDEHLFGVSYRHTVSGQTPSGKPEHATLSINFREVDDPLTGEKAADSPSWTGQAIATLNNVNTHWADNLERFLTEPDKAKNDVLNHGFLANLPYMLILSLPLFALYLKLIYFRTNRNYGAHLVFALHANAFAFALASMMIIIPGNAGWVVLSIYDAAELQLSSPWDYFQLFPVLWLLCYLPVAMHRVYGGTSAATLMRWLILICVHVSVVAMLVVAAEVIGILNRS